MKTHIAPSSLALIATALLASSAAHAGISGIVTSTGGAVTFDDTNSFIGAFPGNLTGTPGAFTTTVLGVPDNGLSFSLPALDQLTLTADFTFTVDPANLNATTVPEPSSALLALLSLPLLLRRRRA